MFNLNKNKIIFQIIFSFFSCKDAIITMVYNDLSALFSYQTLYYMVDYNVIRRKRETAGAAEMHMTTGPKCCCYICRYMILFDAGHGGLLNRVGGPWFLSGPHWDY